MQYIERVDNVERVYNVFYDEEKLNKILGEIIKNVRYEEKGTYTLSYNARVDYEHNEIISGEYLPNGEAKFKDIERIYPDVSMASNRYYDDNIKIDGVQIVVPYLAYIIKRLLRKNINALGPIIDYKNSEELISIDDKIKLLNNKIDVMDNANPDKKIDLLKELKKLLNDKAHNKYFDVDLLKSYYLEVCNCIEVELVSSKVIVSDHHKVLLKDLK